MSYPPEVRIAALELYKTGLAAREVADLQGLNEKTVCNWVTTAGIGRPRGGNHHGEGGRVSPAARAKALLDLHTSGDSLGVVAQRHGVSTNALAQWKKADQGAGLPGEWVRDGLIWRAAPLRDLGRLVPAMPGQHPLELDTANEHQQDVAA